MSDGVVQDFEKYGRAWLRNAIPPAEIEQLRKLSALGSKPGARVSKASRLFDAIASSSLTKAIQSLWPNMQPVRLVSFDKNAEANWGVPWHQDRVIAVDQRVDLPGYSNWSLKKGVWHCEPPMRFLESMLFVRVHLDQSVEENGAMEIALGSHHSGRVPADYADSVADQHPKELTIADAGDVLVLATLTLHRSAPAEMKQHRRVLRVDYASFELPKPLAWAA